MCCFHYHIIHIFPLFARSTLLALTICEQPKSNSGNSTSQQILMERQILRIAVNREWRAKWLVLKMSGCHAKGTPELHIASLLRIDDKECATYTHPTHLSVFCPHSIPNHKETPQHRPITTAATVKVAGQKAASPRV